MTVEKELLCLSEKELWALFPIILKDYNPQYQNWYEEEKNQLVESLKKENILTIHHIGSSAVEGLIGKPTIDILLEIEKVCDIAFLTEVLESMGWILTNQEKDPFKLHFNKGYTMKGFAEKVYHLHIMYGGDWDELYFRDYLRDNPDIAAEYGKLKIQLEKEYKHNRDAYTQQKSEFILKYSRIAKEKYQGKYKRI